MGRVSRALIFIAAVLAWAGVLFGADYVYGQTAPDKLIGTAGGGYEAFDPVTAVQAGEEAFLPFDRIGIQEFNGNSDQAFIDTMRIAQGQGLLVRGDKWYGVNAGLSFNGKVVRYNGTPIPANPDPADLYTYFDPILEGGGGGGLPVTLHEWRTPNNSATAFTLTGDDLAACKAADVFVVLADGSDPVHVWNSAKLAASRAMDGTTAIITDVDGTRVTQENAIIFDCPANDRIRLVSGENVNVYFVRFGGSGGGGGGGGGIRGQTAKFSALSGDHTFSDADCTAMRTALYGASPADWIGLYIVRNEGTAVDYARGFVSPVAGDTSREWHFLLESDDDVSVTVPKSGNCKFASFPSGRGKWAARVMWGDFGGSGGGGGGGSGGGADLSDASPKNIGATNAGTGTKASRGDHVHALDYSRTAPPVSSGTGNPGTAANAARGDHSHPLPDGITQNAAVSNQNKNDINSLKRVRNPALAAATAGYLVRQKSDHTVYEAVAPSAAVLAGLPAITGHGGNALHVNAGATGLEWKAPSGGSEGGGLTFSDVMASGTLTFPISAGDGVTLTNAAGFTADKCNGFDGFVWDTFEGSSPPNEQRWQGAGFSPTIDDITRVPLIAHREDLLYGQHQCLSGDQPPSFYAEALEDASQTFDNSKLYIRVRGFNYGGGGGGGGSNPTIPKPTTSDAGEFLRVDAAGGAYELAAVTQGHPFGVAGDVAALKTGTADAGSSARVARADHAHNFPSTLYGTPVAVGTANAAGTATTLARSDHVHSPGNALATRDQLDAVQDQTDALNRLTVDLILGTPGPLSWADVNADGSEGGVARGATAGETLDNAAGLTYAAPEQTGNSTFMVVRIPAAADPRNYRTVDASEIVLTHSLNIERLIGTKDNWAYYEFPSRLASTETLTLQISGHKIGATTYDGKLGPTAAASIKGHATKLWTHTASATQWAASNGPALADGVNTAIWAGFKGDAADAWQRLELELKHTVSGSPGTDYYARIPLATWREGGQTADNRIRIEGGAFFFGSQLRAIIHLPQPTSFNSTTGTLSIGNCSGCQGNEQIEAVLWGIK